MRYRVTHETRYRYAERVFQCYNVAWLVPWDEPYQRRIASRIDVEPGPAVFHQWTDHFGNLATYFAIQSGHEDLLVRAVSEVEVEPRPTAAAGEDLDWEAVVALLQGTDDPQLLGAREFVLESPLVPLLPGLTEYAAPSFPAGGSLIEGVSGLMGRIHQDFVYDPEFSSVSTPLAEVLEHRRGVCQDFAHLAIGCLRRLGLSARYVSGYIETDPAPGQPRLRGADASHAWFSVFVPGVGWRDFDPTNNQIPLDRHIVTAAGRDYSDVAPLKGVVYGGGKHELAVAVEVERIDLDSAPEALGAG